MSATQRLIMIAVGLSMFVLVFGMSMWHWGLYEMQGVFVALTLIIAVIARMSPRPHSGGVQRGRWQL